MECHIELYTAGRWLPVATMHALNTEETARGHLGLSLLSYETDYVMQKLNDPWASAALSSLYPVSLDTYKTKGWPAFMLDLLPSGAARRAWRKRLNLQGQDGPVHDWTLLLHGAGNPPGNLRITEAAKGLGLKSLKTHPGFQRQDILERREDFINYASEAGAAVAGSTGANGDAPKFLLVEHINGSWHADGAIADEFVKNFWLVKFPRGRQQADELVLQSEGPYLATAKKAGLRVAHIPLIESNTLFVKRFDRVQSKNGIVDRLGLESLASMAGLNDYQMPVRHGALCAVIAKYCDDPEQELIEYIKRDVLNIALGNTDNHPRNTSVLKDTAGVAHLSPLYDVAPMYKDPEGIERSVRWSEEGALPDWQVVLEDLAGIPKGMKQNVRHALIEMASVLEELPAFMKQCGVAGLLVEERKQVCSALAKNLKALRQK